MKKYNYELMLSFILFFCTVSSFSQSFYLTPSFSYGLATDKMNIAYNYNIYYSQVGQTVDEQFKTIRSSFGAGRYYGGNIGYSFTKNVAFELGASYLISNTIEAVHTYKYYYGDDVFTYTYKTKSLQLTPAISISPAKEWEGIKPYVRMGMVMSRPKIYREGKYISYTQQRAGINFVDISKMSYGSVFGIGVTRRVGRNAFLVAEMNFTHLLVHFIETKTIAYTVDGDDSLSSLTPYQLKTIYRDNYTNSYSSSSNTSAPRQEPMLILPFSSIGLNVGIRFTFPDLKCGKKNKRFENSSNQSGDKSSDTSETIYNLVEIMPQYIDGTNALLKFLQKSIKYPSKSLDEKISGTVFLSLIVDKKGNIRDIHILKGVNSELNEEAVRVIKLTDGKWKVGIHDGQNANVRLNIPVKFIPR